MREYQATKLNQLSTVTNRICFDCDFQLCLLVNSVGEFLRSENCCGIQAYLGEKNLLGQVDRQAGVRQAHVT